ncbi:hypothetical protein FE391_44450 [Nonomuraea sp. KC401]|nr:hypothetical protein FE391_44450 [Nonomuraea sp. KC401]
MAGLRWSRECEVVVCEPGTEFAFLTHVRSLPSTLWHYLLAPGDAGGTQVIEQYTVSPASASPRWAEALQGIPAARRRTRAATRAGMIQTLQRIKTAAEAGLTPPAMTPPSSSLETKKDSPEVPSH